VTGCSEALRVRGDRPWPAAEDRRQRPQRGTDRVGPALQREPPLMDVRGVPATRRPLRRQAHTGAAPMYRHRVRADGDRTSNGLSGPPRPAPEFTAGSALPGSPPRPVHNQCTLARELPGNTGNWREALRIPRRNAPGQQ
jgi:hypothetical protein